MTQCQLMTAYAAKWNLRAQGLRKRFWGYLTASHRFQSSGPLPAAGFRGHPSICPSAWAGPSRQSFDQQHAIIPAAAKAGILEDDD